MKYPGSKSRHAKAILAAVEQHMGKPLSIWLEPFVGGANMLCQVPNTVCRIGNDNNGFVVSLFRSLQQGWIPPTQVTEEEYKIAKSMQAQVGLTQEERAWIGFVGVGVSFAGKWFGGYARGGNRNYARESSANCVKQAPKIQNVAFLEGDYRQLRIPPGAVIYADPPYAGTTHYGKPFDSSTFWQWCDAQHQAGIPVFVSEYTAPAHWSAIWSREITCSLDLDTGGKKAVESLWVCP